MNSPTFLFLFILFYLFFWHQKVRGLKPPQPTPRAVHEIKPGAGYVFVELNFFF